MKLLFVVIIFSILLGGFIGGELTEKLFSITGAIIGGIGTFIGLLSLSAMYDSKKQKSESSGFNNQISKNFNKDGNSTDPTIEIMMQLMKQDEADMKANGFVERRLVPHHAIKRDVLLETYKVDFENELNLLSQLPTSEAKKDKKIKTLTYRNLDRIKEVKQMDIKTLDAQIQLIKSNRPDYTKIVETVRSKRTYPFSEDSV